MKTKTLLIAAVMVLSLSVAAIAQDNFGAIYTVSSSPVEKAVETGHAERVGSIGFSTVSYTGDTITGTISIDYHLAITAADIAIPCVDQDGISTTTPVFQWVVEDRTKLVISVLPFQQTSTPAKFYSCRVNGVRVDVSNWSATSLEAKVFATENLLTNGEVDATVLYGVGPGIQSLTNNTVSFSALRGGGWSTSTLAVKEGFRNAFGKITIGDDQTLAFKLLQPIPEDVEFEVPTADTTGTWTLYSVDGDTTSPETTITGDGVTLHSFVYVLARDTNIATIETFNFEVDLYAPRPTVTPYSTDVVLKASVALGPFKNTSIPYYTEVYKDSITSMLEFYAEYRNTVLMIPYATTELGYNTGIAIANTSKSPAYEDADGGWPLTAPLQQAGTLTFYFYDNAAGLHVVNSADLMGTDAQKILVTVSGEKGLLPAGKNYVALISQLLEYAEPAFPTHKETINGVEEDVLDPFTGYILVNCGFTHGHGQYFISDFGDFTNGALMLVLDPRFSNRAFDVPESLGN